MQAVRRFSTAAFSRAPKAAKGKAPPKKASKQVFGKKPKVKETNSSSPTSAFAAKIGSSRAVAKLNPAALRLDLAQSSPAAYTDDLIGSVLETPANVVSQLYALDVLQRQGGYQYFSQLATVVRTPSVALAKVLERKGPSTGRRILLDGPGGSGKSVTMLQAISLALQQRWVVISIPRAEALVDSTFPYQYDSRRKSWRQDTFTADLLGRIAEANKNVLQLQNTSKIFSFDRHSIPEKSTLYKMLEIGAQDPAVSHNIFDAFLEEMNLEGRPSLLMTLDNFTVTTVPSRYRDPDFVAIHPFDLEILKTFISYLNGSKSLTDGVIITNTSSKPSIITNSLSVALENETQSPFEPIDPRIAESLSGVEIMKVGGYSHTEAKAVVQHYATAGLVKGHNASDITDSLVRQRVLMGGALGREVFKSCIKHL